MKSFNIVVLFLLLISNLMVGAKSFGKENSEYGCSGPCPNEYPYNYNVDLHRGELSKCAGYVSCTQPRGPFCELDNSVAAACVVGYCCTVPVINPNELFDCNQNAVFNVYPESNRRYQLVITEKNAITYLSGEGFVKVGPDGRAVVDFQSFDGMSYLSLPGSPHLGIAIKLGYNESEAVLNIEYFHNSIRLAGWTFKNCVRH